MEEKERIPLTNPITLTVIKRSKAVFALPINLHNFYVHLQNSLVVAGDDFYSKTKYIADETRPEEPFPIATGEHNVLINCLERDLAAAPLLSQPEQK